MNHWNKIQGKEGIRCIVESKKGWSDATGRGRERKDAARSSGHRSLWDWTIGRDRRRNKRKQGVTRVTVGHGNVGGEGIEHSAGCWQILL